MNQTDITDKAVRKINRIKGQKTNLPAWGDTDRVMEALAEARAMEVGRILDRAIANGADSDRLNNEVYW